nr:MAG TPA: hypothetical protein [Bacteriophage sp.]
MTCDTIRHTAAQAREGARRRNGRKALGGQESGRKSAVKQTATGVRLPFRPQEQNR